jgi:O-antigen ligase
MRLAGVRTDASLVLGALVLLLLVGYSTNLAAGFWSPRMVVVLVLAALGLPMLVRLCLSPSPARPAALAAGAFGLWALLATVLSPRPVLALVGRYNQGTGLLFIAGLAGAWALGATAGERTRQVVDVAVIAGALVNGGVAVLQSAFDLDVIHLGLADNRAPGLLGNSVHLGAITAASLAMLIPRLPGRPQRWAPAIVLAAAAVQLSGSRAALAVAVIVTAVSCIRLRRAMVLLAAGALIAGVVLGAVVATAGGTSTASSRSAGGADGGLSARTGTWLTTRHSIAAHPLVGVGPGRFQAATSPYRTLAITRAEGPERVFTDAHNLVVEYAVTTGLPGAAALVVWLVLAGIAARGPRLVFALAVLAVGLVEPQSVATTPVALLMLGAAGPLLVLSRPVVAERAVTGVLVAGALVAGGVLLVGDFHLDQARLDSSISHARTAERLLPHWPEPASRLSRNFVFQGELTRSDKDRAEAQRWRLIAARRDPDDPSLWNDVGDGDAKAGDAAGADVAYRRALTRDPWSIRALNGLGRLAAARGDTASARSYFDRSLLVLPNQRDVTQTLSTL